MLHGFRRLSPLLALLGGHWRLVSAEILSIVFLARVLSSSSQLQFVFSAFVSSIMASLCICLLSCVCVCYLVSRVDLCRPWHGPLPMIHDLGSWVALQHVLIYDNLRSRSVASGWRCVGGHAGV